MTPPGPDSTASDSIRVLVVDDHYVARLGLGGLLADQPDMEVVGEAGTDLGPAIFDALRAHTWKVAELRSEKRTLEAAFREIAEGEEVAS